MTAVQVNVANAPATMRDGWIMPSPFSELEEMRAEHQSVVAELAELGKEMSRLKRTFEAEDKAHADALAAAYRDGLDDPKLPKLTPQATRDQKLQAVANQAKASSTYLHEVICEVVGAVQEHRDEWIAAVRADEDAARERVEQLRRELAKAERVVAATGKPAVWIDRTAKNIDSWHIDWTTLTAPLPTELELANQGHRHGPPSPALRRERQAVADGTDVPDYSDEVNDYGSAEYHRELEQTLANFNNSQR